MKITPTMNLGELNARAQNALSDAEANTLRRLLNETEHSNTEDVPEGEWLELLEVAALPSCSPEWLAEQAAAREHREQNPDDYL